jgi:hypothetical protein
MTTPARSLAARVGAHESWARTPDRAARTAPARQAFNARFEALVDPHDELPPQVRAAQAESARKAYFARLSLAAANKRRRTANP